MHVSVNGIFGANCSPSNEIHYMLITFEGIDGCGKSTQIALLVAALQSAGIEPVVCREPGGTPVSERVRTMLLDPGLEISPFTELLLFSAARSELVDKVVRPALRDGRMVILDRFYDSTVAYQGGGRNAASIEWLQDFNDKVTQGLVPSRTYYIRIPPHVAVARRLLRDDPDRMEKANTDFFDRVGAVYDQLASENLDRFVVIDGTASIAAIQDEIWRDIEALSESLLRN